MHLELFLTNAMQGTIESDNIYATEILHKLNKPTQAKPTMLEHPGNGVDFGESYTSNADPGDE